MQHFIITYGPAGSGKGYIKKSYLQKLADKYPGSDFSEDNTFIAEIDSMVEEDEEYIYGATQIMCKFFEDCAKTITSSESLGRFLDSVLLKWNDEPCSGTTLSKSLTQLYFEIRRKYNSQNDKGITKAMKDGKNVIFETTGQNPNPLDWLWRCDWNAPLCKNTNYIVCIVFPIVDDEEILNRAKSRFKSRVMQAYKCFKGCSTSIGAREYEKAYSCMRQLEKFIPPRLPDLEELRRLIPNIQDNLVPYIKNAEIHNIVMVNNNENADKDVMINLRDPNQKIQEFISATNVTKSLQEALLSTQTARVGGKRINS